MSLPLLDQIRPAETGLLSLPGSGEWPGPLEAGEQYRFHFDMTKCIGCKCCEVACAEQNGNPVEISWRRVGEIEAGRYPYTERFHLSMGCNHCLDAACLNGCPVDAYTKDSVTGIVLHSADACIGCGYCTWNCPYSVPQFNAERGVVGKCDMCYHRLEDKREPACVDACPEQAIQIEKVNVEEWRETYQTAANGPGMPSAEMTLSTTRITLPSGLKDDFKKADYHRVRREEPHWPLVIMLTFTQMAAGAFLFLHDTERTQGLVALLVTVLALVASTMHLGRPIHAYRALKMWRRSWLSREVLALSLFAAAAMATAAALWSAPGFVRPLSLFTAGLGFAGITCGAFIYLVPARPAWNTWHTPASFVLTALILGPLFLGRMEVATAALVLQLANQLRLYYRLSSSREFEDFAAARLLEQDLRGAFYLRILLLVAAISWAATGQHWPAFAASLITELLSRYLFFTAVVPRNMALTYQIREAV